MVWLQWVAEVVGPLLLLAVIIWAVMRNRSSSQGINRAERGARELREELSREDENRL
jgi:hypothetical protein